MESNMEPAPAPASIVSGTTLYEKYGTPIALLLGLGLIAGAIFYGGNGIPRDLGNNGGGQDGGISIKDVTTEGSPFIGERFAPLTMAYWFDYQCPFCKRFEQTVMGKLYDEYVATGKLRIVFKDFQFLGDDSQTAALFGRAVWQAYPNKFYAWYRMMFEKQDDENGGAFGNLASIVAATKAAGLGIDTDRVQKLLTDNRATYEAAIAADRDEGSTLGVSGTPSIIVGSSRLAGAQPYEAVKAAIEAELKK